ncbi:MAG: hypothetical protein NVV74_25325 [Magnetospirillum sp.]|nr:hypothetical protein [Magnetospirillum sp.]
MRFRDLYAPLRAGGLVQNQRDLSRMCGKAESYVSSRQSRGADPSDHALMNIYLELDALDQEFRNIILTGKSLTEAEQKAARITYFVQQEVFEELRRRRKGGGK